MTKLTCEECGKSYLYEKDDFCPRCGAYNQPRKSSGAILRVDGVSERNHAGSFTHKEFHREKQQRRVLQMDRPDAPKPRQTVIQQPLAGAGPQRKKENASVGALVVGIIWVIIILQFLAISMFT